MIPASGAQALYRALLLPHLIEEKMLRLDEQKRSAPDDARENQQQRIDHAERSCRRLV
jgi:hypothetical protein